MGVVFTEVRNWNWSKITAVITSAADGSASGTTTQRYTGQVERLVVAPGAAGVQPTNLFDLELLDPAGYDVATGQGANLSNAAPTTVVASMGAIVSEQITVSATNMGNAKSATVYIYVRRN